MKRKKIEVILLQKGMSQREIAEKMGVHQPKVSDWLNGIRVPNSKSLVKFAEVLGETPENLLVKLRFISELDETA
jgi:transcriptional regulator with XRE-family HTH domain